MINRQDCLVKWFFFFLEMNDFRNQFSCDLLDIGGLCLVHLFTGKFQCSMRWMCWSSSDNRTTLNWWVLEIQNKFEKKILWTWVETSVSCTVHTRGKCVHREVLLNNWIRFGNSYADGTVRLVWLNSMSSLASPFEFHFEYQIRYQMMTLCWMTA